MVEQVMISRDIIWAAACLGAISETGRVTD